jgi:hypothetical protein
MKKPIALLFVMMILLVETTSAQISFMKTYASCNLGSGVIQTSDGGYMMVGNSTNNYFTLNKINSTGITSWSNTYGNEYCYGYSVRQTADGGYIAVGHSLIGAKRYLFLVKTAADGLVSWTKTFGSGNNNYGFGVRQTTDGGYIISGYSDQYGSACIYLIKTNSSGTSVWSKVYQGLTGQALNVEQTSDGGYIIGAIKAVGGNIFLIKTNNTGDTTWTKTFSEYNLYSERGEIVKQTSDGGYIITGYKTSEGAIYLIKTDSKASVTWTKKFNNTSDPSGVEQTSDGGYVIIGATSYYGALNGYPDIFMIKTNTGGDTLWTKRFGKVSYDYGRSIKQTSDGGFILTGSSCMDGYRAYLIKTTNTGFVSINRDINTLSDKDIVKISPNPLTNSTTIQINIFNNDRQKFNFILYDNYGNEIMSKELQSQNTKLDRDNLSSGIYFYRIITQNKEIITSGKIIIN